MHHAHNHINIAHNVCIEPKKKNVILHGKKYFLIIRIDKITIKQLNYVNFSPWMVPSSYSAQIAYWNNTMALAQATLIEAIVPSDEEEAVGGGDEDDDDDNEGVEGKGDEEANWGIWTMCSDIFRCLMDRPVPSFPKRNALCAKGSDEKNVGDIARDDSVI